MGVFIWVEFSPKLQLYEATAQLRCPRGSFYIEKRLSGRQLCGESSIGNRAEEGEPGRCARAHETGPPAEVAVPSLRLRLQLRRTGRAQQDAVLRAQDGPPRLTQSLVESRVAARCLGSSLVFISRAEFWLTGLQSAPRGWYSYTDLVGRHCFGIDDTPLAPWTWDRPLPPRSSGVSSSTPLRKPPYRL